MTLLYPLSFKQKEQKLLLHSSNLEAFYEDCAFTVLVIINAFGVNGALVSVAQLQEFPSGSA